MDIVKRQYNKEPALAQSTCVNAGFFVRLLESIQTASVCCQLYVVRKF